MSYDSEDGKDAWKRYRRMVEAIDPHMQEMLHEFGSEQFAYGYAAGVQSAREAVERWYDRDSPTVPVLTVDGFRLALAAIDALLEDSR